MRIIMTGRSMGTKQQLSIALNFAAGAEIVHNRSIFVKRELAQKACCVV